MPDILLVEDDLEMTDLLEQYLGAQGYDLFSLTSPLAAVDKLHTQNFDLVLLDLSLPEMDGLELCRRIKSEFPLLPVIISTARGDVDDKVIGFESGADDYIAKPYDPKELAARIRSHLRRSRQLALYEEPVFTVDEQKYRIYKEGELLELTMAEYEVFALLLRHRPRVLSREFIVNSVSSIQWESSDRSINVIVGRIRSKIGDDVKQPRYIKSVRGTGYQYIGA